MRHSRAAARSIFFLGLTAALFLSISLLPAGITGRGVERIGERQRFGDGPPEKDAARFRVGSRWLRSRLGLDRNIPVNSLLLSVPPVRDSMTARPSPKTDRYATDEDEAFMADERKVSGTIRVLVAAGSYSDYTATPQDLSQLQVELFEGPWRSGTMSEYWDEVSFGNLVVTGDVHGWVPLGQPEDYYTGGFYQGLTIGISNTDEMIAEIVSGLDDTVDFGVYDNDGPDGIPNSGDDDGYVDILVIVHPTEGAECTNGWHMASHSYQYSLWNEEELPLATSDPSANGGVILVDDYNIAPAVSCDGGLIEIGVFCHEFGHLLGLPDLYDTFYRSGIGYWGLMGTGPWNTPESPAHPSGWSREILGWVDAVEIGWEEQPLALEPVEDGGSVMKLILPTTRFRRRENILPVTGHSLICGYTEAEADAREYRAGGGYGNGWHESMERVFTAEGVGPLTLRYDIAVNTEEDYDIGYVMIEGDWGSDTLASYTGTVSSSTVQHDLSSIVPEGDAVFRLRFVFVSDYNFSDEDGWFDSSEGWAMNVDDIAVTGRGLDYSTDLEVDAGGWYCSSEPAEYFLVERRARRGFDSNLPGEGLLIYHAENSIAFSANGNTGGFQNLQTRGVVVEEADNGYEMIEENDPVNHGEPSDPFPGSGGNTLFDSWSLPSSRSNSGLATPVSISAITSQSAVFRAGYPPPAVTSVDPAVISKSVQGDVVLDIRGEGFIRPVRCSLRKNEVTLFAETVEWLGEGRVLARFDRTALYDGQWGLVITGGDGQEALDIYPIGVESVFGEVVAEQGRSYVSISWTLNETSELVGCTVYRRSGDGGYSPIEELLTGFEDNFFFSDSTLVPGEQYRYRIEAVFVSTSESVDVPGVWSVEELPFIFDRAWPNPFETTVKISIFMPGRALVRGYVYDVAGRRVDSFAGSFLDRGTHILEWTPGSGVSTGIYFCRLESGGVDFDFKLVLLR